MAIDPLKCRNHDTFFWRGHAKLVAVEFFRHAPFNHSASHRFVLASLSQIAHVNFNQLRKARHREIPLVSQPVTPTAGLHLRFEFTAHHPADSRGIAGGVKIKIGTEVRPVIERLNDRDFASCSFQRIADRRQCIDSPRDALSFAGQ